MKITATLLKFGEDSYPDYFGDLLRFAPDSLFTDDHQAVALMREHEHGRTAVGVATSIWTEGGTVLGEFDLLDTDEGQQAAIELAANLRRDVSVGVYTKAMTYEPIEDAEPHPLFGPPMRGTITSADLFEVSLCFRGRMPSARVDDVSTDPTPEGEDA